MVIRFLTMGWTDLWVEAIRLALVSASCAISTGSWVQELRGVGLAMGISTVCLFSPIIRRRRGIHLRLT